MSKSDLDALKELRDSLNKENKKSMKRPIFLDANGLTTTSAQHIKDMAGHLVDNVKTALASVSFVNEEMSLIGAPNEKSVVQKGLTKAGLAQLNDLLCTVADAQSLQAWLGEAIRAKAQYIEQWQRFTFDEYCALEKAELNKPTLPSRLTEEEWLNSLNIKERNEYLRLETICAVFGKFIHPNGSLHNAREEAYRIVQKPMRYSENGANTIFHHYTPSCTIEEIDECFFELQNTHRENQARLNGLKHKFEIAQAAKWDADKAEYDRKLAEFNADYRELHNMYINYRDNQVAIARDLKIVIPNDLQGIYDKVSKLGK